MQLCWFITALGIPRWQGLCVQFCFSVLPHFTQLYLICNHCCCFDHLVSPTDNVCLCQGWCRPQLLNGACVLVVTTLQAPRPKPAPKFGVKWTLQTSMDQFMKPNSPTIDDGESDVIVVMCN